MIRLVNISEEGNPIKDGEYFIEFKSSESGIYRTTGFYKNKKWQIRWNPEEETEDLDFLEAYDNDDLQVIRYLLEEDQGNNVELIFDPITGICVIAAIQLATRHPNYNGPSRVIAEKVARAIQARVAELMPDKAAIMEMGWNPDFDV